MIRLSAVMFAMTVFVLSISAQETNKPIAPAGYTWSDNIGRPPKLVNISNYGYPSVPPGNYDVATVPWGIIGSAPVWGPIRLSS